MNKRPGKTLLSLLLAVMIVCTGFTMAPTTVQAATKPTKITLSAKSKTLNVGKTYTLKVKTIKPAKASKSASAFTFKSNKTKVATVSNRGVIKAVAKGNATITVTSKTAKKVKATCKITVKQPVTKVTINNGAKTAVVLAKKKITLKAVATPSNANSKKVKWTSSRKSVATVSATGKVTGKKAGKTTITATATDGSKKKDTITVQVVTKATMVKTAKVTPTAKTVNVGQTVTLETNVTPSKAANAFSWKSSSSKIATVDANGKVKAIKAGKATITGTALDGSKKTVKSTITVLQPVTGITVTAKATSLVEGTTTQVTAAVTPSDASNKAVTWTSSNAAIASVNANGLITAVKAGTATITATAADGSKKAGSVTITVTAKPTPTVVDVKSVTFDKTTADVVEGDSFKLTATVNPLNATVQTLTWDSSDKTVATVADGTVTALKAGTTTITATSNNGKVAKCLVTVKEKAPAVNPATAVTLDQKTATLKVAKTVQLTATMTPSDTTDTITWSSSDDKVATVDANGLVTKVGAGTATITARANATVAATCEVTVITSESAFENAKLEYNFSIDKQATGYYVAYGSREREMTAEAFQGYFEDVMDFWTMYDAPNKSLTTIWNDKDTFEKFDKKSDNISIVFNEDGSKTFTVTKGSRTVTATVQYTPATENTGSMTIVSNGKTIEITDIKKSTVGELTVIDASALGQTLKVTINAGATEVHVQKMTGDEANDVAVYTDDQKADGVYSVVINKTYYKEILNELGQKFDIGNFDLENLTVNNLYSAN